MKNTSADDWISVVLNRIHESKDLKAPARKLNPKINEKLKEFKSEREKSKMEGFGI